MACTVGVLSWLFTLIGLGWIGNLIVTFFAKIKKISLGSPSKDFLLHFLSPVVGFIPGSPATLGQLALLYFAN